MTPILITTLLYRSAYRLLPNMSEQEQEQEVQEVVEESEQEAETEHTKKVRKLDIPQTIEYINHQEMNNIEWENYSKKQCIKILAEKYEAADFPIMEIRSEILKHLPFLIPQYLSKCLPDRFKNPNKVAVNKKQSTTQVLEEPQHHSDGGDADFDLEPVIKTPEKLEPENVVNVDEDYIIDLQNEIKELKEKVALYDPKTPYHLKQENVTIAKLDKVRVTMLQNANTKALKEVVIFIDKRTNEAVKIISDREFEKQQKNM